MPARTVLPARCVGGSSSRPERGPDIGTTVRTACAVCIWMLNRVTGRPTAAASWSRSVCGCGKTANGQSSIAAAGAAICLVSGFYYLPFFVVAACGAFMALIVRVIKNVFTEAIALKDENDFTI